jgi:tetratricopeptide (TPR) repeat protein
MFEYAYGRYGEAEAAFARAVQEMPDNPIALNNLAITHHALGDLDGAAAEAERAILHEPTPAGYRSLGTIRFDQGRYAEAVKVDESKRLVNPSSFRSGPGCIVAS